MERDEAARHLGVAPDAPADVARSAFRRLVRQHHPDVTGDADSTAARTLTEAYRVLTGIGTGVRPDPAPPEPAPPEPPEPAVTVATAGDTLVLDLPPDEAFGRLLDAAAAVGEVTYADPEGGLLEVVVRFDDGRRASIVLSLQGRATGSTDAFATIDAADERVPPPIAVVVEALARELG